VWLSFYPGSRTRKDLCSRIEGKSREFELSQEILKEELLKTLEGGK
jgi:hypothetical protein